MPSQPERSVKRFRSGAAAVGPTDQNLVRDAVEVVATLQGIILARGPIVDAVAVGAHRQEIVRAPPVEAVVDARPVKSQGEA